MTEQTIKNMRKEIREFVRDATLLRENWKDD